MHILITGAAGFLGQRLARALLSDSGLELARLTLADLEPPELDDPRITSIKLDVTDAEAVLAALPRDVDAVYHLAAVVSAQAEARFDLGMTVNVRGTLNLLEAARHKVPGCRFVFASSLAVYGGPLPQIIGDGTAFTPQGSYGTQKAIGELLVNDYSRKGFVDGLTLRLPTVSVRPGKPNQAASSFASDILREPLLGRPALCPVDPSLALWLTSPASAVLSLVYALTCSTLDIGYRSVNVPGITIRVAEMVETLERLGGNAAGELITYERNHLVERIVASWPSRFDTSRASDLGFPPSDTFEQAVSDFMQEEVGEG